MCKIIIKKTLQKLNKTQFFLKKTFIQKKFAKLVA